MHKKRWSTIKRYAEKKKKNLVSSFLRYEKAKVKLFTGLFLGPIRRQFYNLNFFHCLYFGATPGCTASPDIW